jgi:RNA polymerase sigma factor (sigma-70 family)
MKYLKDKTAAQDAVQHVFLKALTHLPEEEIKNFKGWLYVLTRNYCLQQLRDKHYHAGDEAMAAISATETDREALQLKDHTLEQLNEALLQLNEEQRKTIVLFYLHKQSYEQISAQTGFSFAQVKSYIQNGKRNLKQILSKKLNSGS